MDNNIKVLIVDDNCDDTYIIYELLKDISLFGLSCEKSLNSALGHLDKEKFDCILLDLNLPDSTGIDTLKTVINKFPELPIIVLTVIDDEDIVIKSLQNGAQDYLVKGNINSEIVSRSIRYAIERKKVENLLRESEKKYRNITETILEGLWMVDSDAKTTYVNKQLAEMLGYTQEEILDRPFFDFVHERVKNKSKEFFERRKNGIKDRYDFCYNKKDGSILWAIVSASPIFDEKRKFIGAMGLITDITERKLIEESLEKAAREWYYTFNAIKDVICLTDTKGKILQYNNAANKFFNKSPKEVIDNLCWELVNCEFTNHRHTITNQYDSNHESKPLKECPVMRMLKTHHRETQILHIDDKWFYCSVDPLRDNGNIIGGVHIISDITKYKLSQDALKEGEARWRMLTENSPEYIILTDIDGKIQFVNHSIGIPKEQSIGTSIFDYVHHKFIQPTKDCLERVKNTRNPDFYYIEYTNKKDNSIVYLISNVGPIINSETNKITGFIISSSDITERKKIEDKLRESEELYRTIIEYSNDIIWTLDNEGNFVFFNKRAEKISGHKLEDWKGKNFSPMIIEDDLPKVIDMFRSTLMGQANQYEVTIKGKYGRNIILSVNTAPIYSKGKIVSTVSFGRDITENKRDQEKIKRNQEKIKRTTEELARSNKELEQFAYIASHDLQEPLRSISSFTELLARRYQDKLGSDANEFIEYILSGSKRMQQMINDLLALSRVGTKGKEFEPTNVQSVIQNVFRNLHSIIIRNNTVITIDDMPIINADSFQIAQLFQNLIENAIKFRKKDITPQIHISAEQRSIEEGFIKKDEWVFSVKDNGIGIDPKNFSKLFVIFQRLNKREEYPGTGIGLAMCRKIVERHRGKIWVESQPGEGSTFYFSIPIKRGENDINGN